jgi:hypothetical protein
MGARAIDAPGRIMTTRAITITGFALVIGAMITLEVIGRRRTGWHYFARLAATRRPVMRRGGPLG